MIFDTEEDTVQFGSLILNAATGDAPTMPPAGGPVDDDRERLTIWLTCFAQ